MTDTKVGQGIPVWPESMLEAEYTRLLYDYYKTVPLDFDVEQARRDAFDPNVPKKTTAEVFQMLKDLEKQLTDAGR